MMVIPSEFILCWETAAALIAIILVYSAVQWWLDPLREMPGPSGFPFLGNTLDIVRDSEVFETLIQRSRTYGPVWKESSLFGKPFWCNIKQCVLNLFHKLFVHIFKIITSGLHPLTVSLDSKFFNHSSSWNRRGHWEHDPPPRELK